MRLVRIGRGTALLSVGALALAVWACETARNIGGIQRDQTPPVITLTNTAGDTQDIAGGLRFNVSAVDNLALLSVNLTFSGGLIGTLDTTFLGQVKTYSVARQITFPAGSGAGGNIMIVGRATDGAGNFAADTIFIFLRNVQALQVTLISPTPGAIASQGRSIPIQVRAIQNSGIAKIGFLVAPAAAVTNPTVPPNDSIVFLGVLRDTALYTDTLNVVAATGTFDVIGFAEDSAGRRGFTNIVTVTIQSAVNDVTPPLVSHSVGARVEVNDTVIIRATDPSAISWIGFRVDTSGLLLKFDTINVAAGNLTDVTRRASLNLGSVLPPGVLPHQIVVRGYACDGAVARNCSYTNTTSLLPSAPITPPIVPAVQIVPPRSPTALIDTVIVVNGLTVQLAGTGTIADAIYNANLRELYLTNPGLNRVDVFQVANTSFVAGGIPTAGGQPWGIALWPRDTLGGYKDTIIVADAGGSYLGIINVGAGGPRQIIWRQSLPDFIIQTYKVIIQAGGAVVHITDYHTSDLPQYLATVCRVASGTSACHADSVFAIYSTAPTGAETPPFNGRATLRMEKLINTTDPNLMFGHLFWEIGTQSFNETTDTLRIFLSRGRNFSKVILSACGGATINLARMGLGDRTFTRNTGNFTHAFIGEGGNITAQFARVMSYDARNQLLVGTAAGCSTGNATRDSGQVDIDFGMSPGREVSDFIANTGIRVVSVATNFNGLTNAVRADSIYYLDQDLRRMVTSAAPPGPSPLTPGMDMNYFHDFAPTGQCPPGSTFCGGGTDKNQRLMFSASPSGNIDVFDTFFGAFLGSIPVRDPIIGPLRVARDAGGNQLLFGVTPTGLLVVQLPPIVNPLPVPPHH
ncbi:MAG: hypothetical protein DMD38_10005 [Gemmatimonadetes bacterium]|nr:MAG: hypothetical protein AUG85_06715 [Gemmatimonadetes bacterium 13_1_20CM_4_66_11]PYP96038.1 MAG: hypothetical protein DMD38_10005 [Gemmatimonadota bacterium]